MQNYPFYVIRERGRLTFVQEFERKEGAKKRMKEFRNQTKAKQKCRIRKLLNLEPNQKIYEDDLIDLQREYTEEILQLKDQIRRLSTTLAHFEEVEDIQEGSIFKTAPSNSLIEKYVKTREPDFHLMELQQENEDLSIELDDLREAISQESINELQEEEYDNSKEIMRILGDCRYFQNLIDEFDSKLQHFKPDPQVQELKSKKAEIKQNIQEEIKESNRLQELLASGKFLDDNDETEPRLDFEESVFPIRKTKHSIKKYLEAKKKEYEDLCANHQKEIDDINNNVRSPEFYVTLRTLDDLSEARKRTNERFQEQQLEQFQRLNSIRPPEIISSSSSKEEPKVPTIQIPTVQNKTTPPKKKKVVKQLGPPSFLIRQQNQQTSKPQPTENQPQKPIKRVKQTSSHLFEPKKYSSTHQVPEQKPMQFYKKPPKSSQHDEKWKEELEEIRKEKEFKQKELNENDQSSQKSVHNDTNMEASIDLKIEMNVTTEKNNPDQSDDEMELTKENDDNQAEQKVRNVKRDPVNAIDKTEEEMLNSLLSTALATLSTLTDNKNNQNEEPSNIEEKHNSNSNENNQEQLNGDTEEKLNSSIERRVDNDSKEKARDYSSDDNNSNEKADNDVDDSGHEKNSHVDKKVSDYSSDDKNSDANEHTSNKSVEDVNSKEASDAEMKENPNVLSSLITSGINSLIDTKANNEPQSNEGSIINHDSNQSQHNDESNDSLKDDFDSSSSDNKAVDSPTKDDVNNQTIDSSKHSSENNESNAANEKKPDESVTTNEAELNSSKDPITTTQNDIEIQNSNSSKESIEKSQTELNDTKDEESDASNQMKDSDSFDFFSAHSDDDANKATSEKDKSNNESENENIHGSSKEDLNSSSNTKSLVNTNQSPTKSSTSELRFESDSHVISNEMKSSEHQSGAEPQKLQGLVTNIIGSLTNQPNDSIDKGSASTHQAQSDDEIVSASLSEHNVQKSSSED